MFRKDLVLIAVMVMTLVLMIMPLSPAIIDALLAVNITISVLLLVVAVYLKKPADFYTFPSVILVVTAFRLALSIATTRLILTEADAGSIIQAFGEFVVGGSIAVGVVMFLIITVVQFLVVTKGAERVAEVSARFALDALPGKQMAIDAEMRAGGIDNEEASRRRRQLQVESQFFGSMDGAMKFVKGDAIAGLIIIAVNLIGGISIGMGSFDLSFGEAVQTFSLLTIGDGLVAQVPALLISMCAGMVVTRISAADDNGGDLGNDILDQLVSQRRVMFVAGGITIGMAFVPGFPTFVFLSLAGVLIALGFTLPQIQAGLTGDDAADGEAADADTNAGSTPAVDLDDDAIVEVPTSKRISLVVINPAGAGIDEGKLYKTVIDLCSSRCRDIGIDILPIGTRFVHSKDEPAFAVVLDDVPIFRTVLRTDAVAMSLASGSTLSSEVDGVEGYSWPSGSGVWVLRDMSGQMEKNGQAYSVDLTYEIAQSAFRVFERSFGQLFGRAECKQLMVQWTQIDSDAMEAIQGGMSMAQIHETLRLLVIDGAPLRPYQVFVETMAHWLQTNKGVGPAMLADLMRGSMRRQLSHSVASEDGRICLAMVDPTIETLARNGLDKASASGVVYGNESLHFDANVVDNVVQAFRRLVTGPGVAKDNLVIVIGQDLRRKMRNFLADHGIHIPVFAPNELSPEFIPVPIALVQLPDTGAAKAMDAVKVPEAVGRK